jgi:cell division protein FtsB
MPSTTQQTQTELHWEKLVEMVYTLQKRVDSQARDISELRSENAQLRAENAELKADNAQLKADISELVSRVDAIYDRKRENRRLETLNEVRASASGWNVSFNIF